MTENKIDVFTRYEVTDKPSGIRPTTSITLNNFRRNNDAKYRK